MKFTSKEELDIFVDLITRMLEYDPAKRMTFSEALNHPFIKPFIEGIELHLNSNKSLIKE